MRLASYHRSRGNDVRLVRGISGTDGFQPDRIEVTSLFTYAWQPVHEAIRFYRKQFPNARIRVGGIYATLMPSHLRSNVGVRGLELKRGLYEEIEHYMPDYEILEEVDKWKGWETSMVFTSRGCVRNCPFCVVPRIEGRLRSKASEIINQIYPKHKKVTIWDNNFLASPDWKKALNLLRDLAVSIDFNQGLDARLVDQDNASLLSDFKMPFVRMAYDSPMSKKAISRAVALFSENGIKPRRILFYVLYNFYDHKRKKGDTPTFFLDRIRYISELGCVSYPMRYEPANSLKKNQYVSPLWTPEKLELIAKARRVIGYGGAFPPYEGLVKKFNQASQFDEAFSLSPRLAG